MEGGKKEDREDKVKGGKKAGSGSGADLSHF